MNFNLKEAEVINPNALTKPVTEGFLKKRSPRIVLGVRPWQSRLFCLDDTSLYWYKTRKDQENRHPSGILRLDMIEATELNKDCPDGCEFNVLCRGGRQLELKSESSADSARWLVELTRSRQLSPSAVSHPSELNELNQEKKFWKPNIIQKVEAEMQEKQQKKRNRRRHNVQLSPRKENSNDVLCFSNAKLDNKDNKIILDSGSIDSDQPQGGRIVDVAKTNILSAPSLETRSNIGSTSSVISVTSQDFSKDNIEESVEYFAKKKMGIHCKRVSSEKKDESQRHSESHSKHLQNHNSLTLQSFSQFTSENGATVMCSENEVKRKTDEDRNQQPLMSFSAYANHDVSSNLSSVPPPKPSLPERSYSTILDVSSDSSLTTNSSRSSDEEANHEVSIGLEGELLRTRSNENEAECVWTVLRDDTIFFYAEPHEKGLISFTSLWDIQIEPCDNQGFKMKYANEEWLFHVPLSSQIARDKWIQALEAFRDSNMNRNYSPSNDDPLEPFQEFHAGGCVDGIEHNTEKSPVTAMSKSSDCTDQSVDYDSEHDTSDDCQSVSKRDRSAFDSSMKRENCNKNGTQKNENNSSNKEESGEWNFFHRSPHNYTYESLLEIGNCMLCIVAPCWYCWPTNSRFDSGNDIAQRTPPTGLSFQKKSAVLEKQTLSTTEKENSSAPL